MKDRRFYIKLLFNILRIVIPVGLLTFIFLNIDIEAFSKIFLRVDLKYFLISVFFTNIMTVITAGVRWYFMIRKEIRSEKFFKYISTYWSAMFYGYFVPSNAGMDVYRVAVAGKKHKNYERHIAVLLGEKIYTLVISIVIMFASFAIVYNRVDGSEVAFAIKFMGVALLLVLLVAATLYLFFRKQFSSLASYLKNRLYHYGGHFYKKISSRISLDLNGFRDELSDLTRKNSFITTVLFTLLLRIWLAIGGYFLFLAFGIKLSFWVLLFANTVFFLIFIKT